MLREEAGDTEKQFTYDRQGGIIEERNPSGIRSFAYRFIYYDSEPDF